MSGDLDQRLLAGRGGAIDGIEHVLQNDFPGGRWAPGVADALDEVRVLGGIGILFLYCGTISR